MITAARNLGALVLREGCSKGVYLVLSALIARRYGKDLLGQYVLAFLIPRLFFSLAEMGLNTLLVREVAKARSALATYMVSLGFLKLLLGIATLLGMMGFARLFYASGALMGLLFLSGLSHLLIYYLYLFNAAFRAFEQMGYEARIMVWRDILFLASSLLWLWRGEGLGELFLFFLAANGIALGYGAWLYRRVLRPSQGVLDFKFCRKLLGGAKEIWLISLASMLYLTAGSLILSILEGEGAVGLYNAAFLFAEMFILGSVILTTVFFPIFSREASDPLRLRETYAAVFKLSLFCFLPFQISFFAFADKWLELLFGPPFLEALVGVRVLMAIGVFFVMGSLHAHCLIACRQERWVATWMAVLLLVNIALNLWWVPSFSFVGSCLAIVLCESVFFFACLTRIRRTVGALSLQRFLGKLLVAGGVMASSTLLLPRSGFPLAVFIGFVLYLSTDLLTRGYLWQERNAIRTLWVAYAARS